jgi:hypothetical protein
MDKDKRYSVLKKYLESGHVKVLEDMYEIVPKTTIRKDLKLSQKSIEGRMDDKERFYLGEIVDLAELIECDPMLLIGIAMKEIQCKRKNK